MKYLFLAILLTPLVGTAQFNRSDKFIGGTFSVSSQRGPDNPNYFNKISSFSLQPQVGFLLNENLAIGGVLGYSYSQYKTESVFVSENTFRGYSAGILIRKFYPITDKFLFAINSNLNFYRNLDKNTSQNISYENKSNSLELSIQPLFIFFPSARWGIEAGLGYISFTHRNYLSSDQKVNSFNFSYGYLSFGVSYYIRKGEKQE